jgi:Domain of unknown function (DUF4926)
VNRVKRKKMIQELERIVLTTNLPEYDLQEGDVGTVVLIHQQGKGYEVEFVKLDGETFTVVTLLAAQLRAVSSQEITHARTVQTAIP